VTAATLFGVGGTFAQFLFQHRGVSIDWLVTMRLLCAISPGRVPFFVLAVSLIGVMDDDAIMPHLRKKMLKLVSPTPFAEVGQFPTKCANRAGCGRVDLLPSWPKNATSWSDIST